MAPGNSKPATEYTPARREPRTRTEGELTIELSPKGKIIRGRLSDVSPHGFCITHDHDDFFVGQEVRVLYSWGKAPARVVWIGARGGAIATGFRTD